MNERARSNCHNCGAVMLGTGGYDIVAEILAERTAVARTTDLRRDKTAAAAKQVGQPKASGGGCFWLLVVVGISMNYFGELPWRQLADPSWWSAKIDEVAQGQSRTDRAAQEAVRQRQLAEQQAVQDQAKQVIAKARAQEQALRSQAAEARQQADNAQPEGPAPAQAAPLAVSAAFDRSAKRLKLCLRPLKLPDSALDLDVELAASGEVLDLQAVGNPKVKAPSLACLRAMLRRDPPPPGYPGHWRVSVAPN